MLTFLPPCLAIVMLWWVGVPWYLLLLTVLLAFILVPKGRSLLARADHHAGADGRWLSEGKPTWRELWVSWSRQPIALLTILTCLGALLWEGQNFRGPQVKESLVSSQHSVGEISSMGMKEMVEVLKRYPEDKKLEEKLGHVDAQSLQQGEGGEAQSGWTLQSWSQRRPFGEIE